MEKYVVWYRLWLKAYSRKKMYWLQVFGMALVLFLVASISVPDQNNVTVGIYCEGAEYSRRLADDLLAEEGVFDFLEYDKKESLYADVLSGELECGFLFDEMLDQKIEEGNLKRAITYVGNSFSTKGETVQETVYAGLFRIYSDEILRQNEEDIFGDTNEERLENWLAKNHEYQDSDAVFQLEIQTADFAMENDREGWATATKTEPVKGMIGLFVFFVMFMAYGNRYSETGQKVDKALHPGERFGYACMNQLAAGTVPAMAGLIGMACFVDNLGIGMEFLRIVLLVVMSSVWITIFGHFLKSGTSFAGAIVSLLLVNVLVCPVFINVEAYVPAIRYVRMILPLGWYLCG